MPCSVSDFLLTQNLLVRILLNVLYCAKINRDKANGKYDKYIGYGDDRDPEFVMIL